MMELEHHNKTLDLQRLEQVVSLAPLSRVRWLSLYLPLPLHPALLCLSVRHIHTCTRTQTHTYMHMRKQVATCSCGQR